MLRFKRFLEEGKNDPGIFKAVFLAGGPGAGKSFIVGKTALIPLGLKLINSDPAFEKGLKDAGLKFTPSDIASAKGQAIRQKAKALTKKKMELALKGRLGLLIDGTGKDLDRMMKQAMELQKLGYDTSMIFVNTDLETALERNRKRNRSLPDEMVKKMWSDVQNNIGKFQVFFGNTMYIVDNSEGSDWNAQVARVYKRLSAWIRKTPQNRAVKQWMDAQ